MPKSMNLDSIMHLPWNKNITIRNAAYLSRLWAFAFSIISLALVALTLSERDWMDGFSIYIIVAGCLTTLGVWIPPFPNFVYDGLFTVVWALATVFALLITVLKSTCYGIANAGTNDNATACSKYKSMVVMCFLAFLGWLGCTVLASIQLTRAIWKNMRLRKKLRRPDSTEVGEEQVIPELNTPPRAPEEDQEDRNHKQPPPAGTRITEKKRLSESSKTPMKEFGILSKDKEILAKDKEKWVAESRDDSGDDITPPLGESDVYQIENRDDTRSPTRVEGVTYLEEVHEKTEDEYTRVNGLFSDFILTYWVWLTIAGLIALAIILPIVIIYGIPAFGVYIVNHIELPDSLTGTFHAFNEHNLTLDVTTKIKVPLTIRAKLLPTDLILFNPENPSQPAAHILTTPLKFKGGTIVSAKNQYLEIGNQTEWERLWKKFFFHDTFGLGAKGKLQVHVGPLKTHVDVYRAFTFPGVINASTLELDYLRIQPPDQDGCNLFLRIHLTNPTPLEINSDARFIADVFIGNTSIATAFIDPFILLRRNTTVTAKAKVDFDTVSAVFNNFLSIVGTELPYVSRGWVALTIQGASISQNGHTWPYWVTGANGIKLPAAVNIDTPIFGELVQNILASTLTGNAPFSFQPGSSVMDIDVTPINKLLTNITIVDATTL